MNKMIVFAFISCCQAVFTLNWSNICSCGNLYTQVDCEMAACTWANNSCSKAACSTFTTEATCLGGCFWNSAADCYLKTRGTYVWKNNACVVCSISHGLIPVVMLIGQIFLCL